MEYDTKMQKGMYYGQDMIDLIRDHNLFAVDTWTHCPMFKPQAEAKDVERTLSLLQRHVPS